LDYLEFKKCSKHLNHGGDSIYLCRLSRVFLNFWMAIALFLFLLLGVCSDGFMSSVPSQVRYPPLFAKKLSMNENSRIKLVAGINQVANAVKVTLGPKGRNVVIDRPYGYPEIVNDGVTIAKAITLEDPEMNVGARLIQEVASKAESNTGDGTTTSTVLVQEIVNQGIKILSTGANPVALRNGIMKASSRLSSEITRLSRPVSQQQDLANIATIAANNHEMGAIIAEAFGMLGNSGSTVVEDSQTLSDSVEFVEGISVGRGFLSPYFVKDPKRQICELTQPRVLVTDQKISSLNDILPLLNEIARTKSSLLIIADDVSGEALSTLVMNKLRGVLDVVAVRAPSYGDRRTALLQDLAVATGSEFISDAVGISLDSVTIDQLGRVSRAVVSKDRTSLVTDPSYSADITMRIEEIKAEMDVLSSTSSGNSYQQESLQDRLTSLGGGIARIRVGAATETELKDKKLRYEDAINSVKSALEMGVVPGGGSLLLQLSSNATLKQELLESCEGNEDMKSGVEILFRSLSAPMRQISINCGLIGDIVVEKCRQQPFGSGFNALTGKFENLLTAGVIDPAKVTKNALETAASMAGLILTTEVLVTDLSSRSQRGSDVDGEEM
jgi:chaperonin GroEL